MLADVRRAVGLSREEATVEIGISHRTLQRVESGTGNPSRLTRRAIEQWIDGLVEAGDVVIEEEVSDEQVNN